MWSLLAALLTVESACLCVCVDGLAKTECATSAAARAEPSACGDRLACVALEQGPGQRQELNAYFQTAHPNTANGCREVRVRRDESGLFEGVRVCDLIPD